MDAGTYNVRKATCGGFCQTCNGVTGWSLIDTPFAVAVSGQHQQTLYETWNSGSQYNDNSLSSWTTSNGGVATVQTRGNTSPGLVKGVSPGSATISAQAQLADPQFLSYWCENNQWSCPLTDVSPSGSAPGDVNSITVHFSGALSTGDNLSFNNVAQTCSSRVWNVEIEANVYDDAANYTVSQGLTGLTKGYYKTSSGTLKSFSSSTNKPAPQDNPPSAVLQQVSGQKVIFWIDAPGRGTTYTDPNNSANSGPIDSMTDVKNFTSSICAKANPNSCYPVSWYIKIVVKPGGTLDMTNSAANFGSLSLNF